MRATWVGARSGRSSIWIGPLVVSRMSVFASPSVLSVMGRPCLLECCLLEFSVVDEPQGHRASGQRIAERLGERQRRAAAQRLRHRDPIGEPLVVGGLAGLIG